MEVKGLIKSVDLKSKTFSLLIKGQLKYFYFQNNLLKRFRKYLYSGNVISFVCEESEEIHGLYFSKMVIYVIEIFVPTTRGKRILYNKELLNESLLNFFESIDNMMFLDLEMTMPSYNKDENFVPEIIQAGFFIVNKNGKVLLKENYYVRPTKVYRINKRTSKFLHIDSKVISKEAISYYKFYNKFKMALKKYRPAIMIFGRNDKLVIENSYNINGLPSLAYMSRFVNLSQLIKNYFELKNDPGLFYLYEKFSGTGHEQTHDALEDALVTYEVYKYFLEEIKQNNNQNEGELLRQLE